MPLLDAIQIDYGDYNTMKKIVVNYKSKTSDTLHVSFMIKVEIKQIIWEGNEFDKIPEIKKGFR